MEGRTGIGARQHHDRLRLPQEVGDELGAKKVVLAELGLGEGVTGQVAPLLRAVDHGVRIGCGCERHRDAEPLEDSCSCECAGVCEPQVGDVEPSELQDSGLESSLQLEPMLPHRRCRQAAGRAERHSLDRDGRALSFTQPGVTPVGLGLGESPCDRHHTSDLGLGPEGSAELNEQRRDPPAVPHTRVCQLAVESPL